MAEELLTLVELCKELSISTATGRNWLKLGKLTASEVSGRRTLFTREYAEELKSRILSGENGSLKSRRNKKYITGSKVYSAYVPAGSPNRAAVEELLVLIEARGIVPDSALTAALTAECGTQLIAQKCGGAVGYTPIVEDIITGRELAAVREENPELFAVEYTYTPQEDTLGLVYISLRSMGERKADGAYYTPTAVVKKLTERVFSGGASGKVLDPCCGTGNFLMQLPEEIPPEQIYGNDTDAAAVKLARLNMALRYGITDMGFLRTHITERDYLSEDFTGKWDYIIGNPPWGYEFTAEEKSELRRRYGTASGSTAESYDIFIEKALELLETGGELAYVLPEAILNVKSHTAVRSLLVSKSRLKYLEYLGNAFEGVSCPCVIMAAQREDGAFDGTGLTVLDGKREYRIEEPRSVTPELFSFGTDDKEYVILRKLETGGERAYLKGKAEFALGIVTGNNKRYITGSRTESNEPVLKGADLSRYRYKESGNYIEYRPEQFQQTAPEKYYRAPEKLLYRFISSQLIFAYDDRQRLSLNSCNIMIPHIEGMGTKYIMAVLNSRPAQYYFSRSFNSVKVLRSHIEQIPLPTAPEGKQAELTAIADLLISGTDNAPELYDSADRLIAELYGLTAAEYAYIYNSIGRK